jgi:catechol 2,3-dioxygenase-like lactoylglutathione lyase family enzyme
VRAAEGVMAELFHVGLTVKNLERSLEFYRDVAGMSAGGIFDGQSEEFDTLTNNPGARLRGVHLKAGAFMLQLLEYRAGGGSALDLHHNNVGSPHFCFYVPDVEAKYAEIQKRGDVKVTSGIVPIARDMRSFYTEDPDGVPVEFLQRIR